MRVKTNFGSPSPGFVFSVITMGPEPIWGSISNVPSLGRCRAPGGLSQSLRWVAFITVMNALQRNETGADAVLANDTICP